MVARFLTGTILATLKILINDHALIHNLLEIGEFFFTFFLEIPACNKCPPVNLEKKYCFYLIQLVSESTV